MRLLPYERLELRSPLGPDEAAARLTAAVAARRWSFKAPPEPFTGWVRGRQFEVMRTIRYRNSFLPVVTGEIAPDAAGARIRVVMRLHLAVAAFMIVWFGFVLTFAVAAVVSMLRHSPDAPGYTFLAVPAAMAAFGYGLVSLGFWPEVRKARTLLAEILGCRVEEARNRLVRS